MHLTYRTTCRICGSSALTEVINLEEQHLQGSFLKPEKETPPLRKISTQLVRCDPTRDEKACGLLQAPVTVPPTILYSAYWYRSGTNQTMRSHLKGIASVASDLVSKANARVLDIGCNDGTLLSYYPSAYQKFGVDPSDIAQEIGAGVRVVQDIFPSTELTALIGNQRFDVVTSIAMFYDLENPVAFVDSVKSILEDEGVWIFEVSYMPKMLAMNSYDTICHEHLEYYSFSVIENLMARCGMKVFKVEFNSINGGSIRCYVTQAENFRFKSRENQLALAQVRHDEFELELDTDKPYKNFQDRIDRHKEELSALLKGLKREGKKIHIYGASTKGNTILQWCGLDNTVIDYAADRNPDKDGAMTIGTNIPIISEEKSRAMNPDYYLVLPWHFRDEFLTREAAFLDRGGAFIFPLPNIEIYKH
jgi:cyclopropane fatty-acyl-phospholipid synthase-like methyltransferase